MNHPDRQKVYDALDEFPEMIFAALVSSLQGLNIVLALTVLDNPSPCEKLAEAIQPYVDRIGGQK